MKKNMNEVFLNMAKEFKEENRGKYAKVGSIENKIIKDIENGKIDLDGECLEFKEVILKEKIKMKIPEGMDIMDPEIAAIKYSAGPKRPEYIYTMDDNTVNMVVNFSNTGLKETELKEFKNQMMEFIKTGNKKAKFLDEGTTFINGKAIAFFEVVFPVFDGNMYNYFFFVEVENHVVIFNINCLDMLRELWEIIARGMMNTIEVI